MRLFYFSTMYKVVYMYTIHDKATWCHLFCLSNNINEIYEIREIFCFLFHFLYPKKTIWRYVYLVEKRRYYH